MSLPQEPAPARVLVVEDDPRSRKLLEGYLAAEGYDVLGAADGASALALGVEHVPDVVLLDVMMPGMTGHEVCAQLKHDPRTRLCQVMMVTALSGTQDTVQGLDVGADDYLPKPVRREEFLAKVRALLRVRRLLLELETARGELSERNRELELKRLLAQSLVHDLKNPLTAVLGNLELLELQSDDSALSLLRRALQGAARMKKMILDLLDVERLEEGRLEPRIETVDAVRLVVETLDEVESWATVSKTRIERRLPAEAWVRADPALLRRVLDNLLANALSHAGAAGLVAIAVEARDEGLEICVADDGPGIPEPFRELVFEKYVQVDLRHHGVTANRGLGLTFCRLAIEALGGSIWVDAAPGGGARFHAVLPDAESATEGSGLAVGPAVASGARVG